MKRRFFTGTILFSPSIFAGTLKVETSPIPHAKILNFIKEDLKNEGKSSNT